MTSQLREALMQVLSNPSQPNQEKPRKPALLAHARRPGAWHVATDQGGGGTLRADVGQGKFLDKSSDDGALDEIDISPDKYDTIDLSDPQVERAKEINRILDGLRQGGFFIKRFGDPSKPAQFLIKKEDEHKTQEELDAGAEQTSEFDNATIRGKSEDLNNEVIEEALQRYFNLTAPKKKKVTPDVIAEAE
jgi:hypothetical protein